MTPNLPISPPELSPESQEFDLSPTALAQWGVKAGENPLENEWWRLNNLYYIKNVRGQKVKFRLNRVQKQLYQNMWYRNTILKARQVGATTFIQLFMLDRCLFNSHTSAGVIAQGLEDAIQFFDAKIKFAYDNLPEEIKKEVSAESSNRRELSFSNGSKIYVGTSLRSGTYQYLHVSEYGKLCAREPLKAQEVRLGALQTVHQGLFIFIESTAEGNFGDFYERCQAGEKFEELVRDGEAPRTEMDYRFHFFPWYEEPSYRIDFPVKESDEMTEYFARLSEEHDIKLDRAQRAWYCKNRGQLDGEMLQEYPSFPAEAFEKAVAGAIFARQLETVYFEGRVADIPIEPGTPVNVFWDLGKSDQTAMWFHQRVGAWEHFIWYYENKQEFMPHYINYLNRMRDEKGWFYGTLYLPHDGKTSYLSAIAGSVEDLLVAAGFRTEIVPRTLNKQVTIEDARRALPRCKFDKTRTKTGMKALGAYRYKHDENNNAFLTPLHDWSSNGSDAFQVFAQRMSYAGGGPPASRQDQPKVDRGRRYIKRMRTESLWHPSDKHIL